MQQRKNLNPDGIGLRPDQVAAMLNVGYRVVHEAIKSGRLAASKLGIHKRSPVVVQPKDIAAWLDAQRMVPALPLTTQPDTKRARPTK